MPTIFNSNGQPWHYTLMYATYGDEDISQILNHSPIQQGYTTAGKVIGLSRFHPSKKLKAFWRFDYAPTRTFVFESGFYGTQQRSSQVIKQNQDGTNSLLGYLFEASYETPDDLFMHPCSEFTKFILKDEDGRGRYLA